MIYALGRLLQMFGLIVLPISMLMQLNNQWSVGQMLMGLVCGISAFYLGRLIEGYASK